jgi:hypothetical protein
MIPRIRWVGFAALASLTIATACLAAEGEPVYRPGLGGIGGQLGGSYFGVDRLVGADWFGDYSNRTVPRLSFAGQFRYVRTRHWRWQVSPGFTWSGYTPGTTVPNSVPNPSDDRKDNLLVLLLPTTAQYQYVTNRGRWLYHAGLGPGVYRVWVENRRDIYRDPSTKRVHRGAYPGGSVEFGAERFLKVITTTSVEFTWVTHLVFAQRAQQFPNGYNSNLMATELRVGINYYFDPLRQKKQGIDIPDAGKPAR